MTKKTISVLRESYAHDALGGTLAHARRVIDDLIAKYGEDAVLEFSLEREPYCAGESISSTIHTRREETDEEYSSRMEEEQIWNCEAR